MLQNWTTEYILEKYKYTEHRENDDRDSFKNKCIL